MASGSFLAQRRLSENLVWQLYVSGHRQTVRIIRAYAMCNLDRGGRFGLRTPSMTGKEIAKETKSSALVAIDHDEFKEQAQAYRRLTFRCLEHQYR